MSADIDVARGAVLSAPDELPAVATQLEGRIVCSCLVLGVEAEGHDVVTIEGIARGEELHPVQKAFLENAVCLRPRTRSSSSRPSPNTLAM